MTPKLVRLLYEQTISRRFWHSRMASVFMLLSVQRNVDSEGRPEIIMLPILLLSTLRFCRFEVPKRLIDVSLL